MADRNIIVTPDEVVRTARMIDSDIEMYVDSYINIYRASDEMRGHWEGRDNTAFNNKLSAYQSVLREMESLIREYSAYLDRSAIDYRGTQDWVVDGANQLP